MYTTSLSIILSLLLPYGTLFSAAASERCFEQTGNNSGRANGSYQVSPLGTCSGSSCQFQYGGYLNVPSTLDFNSIHTAEIYAAIGKELKIPFKASTYGAVCPGSSSIQAGRTGYLTFTPNLECYFGNIIGADCFSDVPPGTPVTACKAVLLTEHRDSKGVQCFDGPQHPVFEAHEPVNASSIVELPPPDDSRNNPHFVAYEENPALSVKPNAESGAVRLLLLGQGGGWWPTMMVAVAAVGVGSCSFFY